MTKKIKAWAILKTDGTFRDSSGLVANVIGLFPTKGYADAFVYRFVGDKAIRVECTITYQITKKTKK